MKRYMKDPCEGCFVKDGGCGTPCTACPDRPYRGRALVQIGNANLPENMICLSGDDNGIELIGPQSPVLEAPKRPRKKSWLEKKQRGW